ncbi:hypothetical protein BTO19_03410 [Vibrio parahaemolyticus]|uniref:hypothetical protein n=1 Tax=Vibrio parahaemolyticus TaxID=670 RepID=UPI000A3C9CBC|nr:hypothetical protein [Vibrio parahaemolyticus]MBY7718686.1 hypothetical protein [Vibrio parahaemolyticus]MCZ6373547.1 hypothetical protein [Vibrio parahaemolyticus]MDF4658275.1 hypothetical protein [Vibrio parahaemolyticus]OUJ28162.1 hypothetical protein BTO19_03410 [Vibrio parahaemolyticus]TBT65823.1 hypothetical protein D5E77_03710 [Vibrio parahaemolyticus]
MAFHVPKEQLQAHSFRECDFYINYLNDAIDNAEFRSIEDFDTVQECLEAIRKELSYLEEEGDITHSQIKKLQADFQKHQLSNKNFLWLNESDDRFCNWVWCYLRENSVEFDRAWYRDQIIENQTCTTIQEIDSTLDVQVDYSGLAHAAFKKMSNNMAARKHDIIECFQTSELNLSHQLKLIETLLSTWQRVSEDTRVSKWLESDQHTKSDWLWDYLKETGYRLQRIVWSVSNERDKRDAIIAMFDILDDNPDRKSLLIGKMKRAWSQKKFRDKSNGKRPYSVSMTDRTKERLTWLVKQDDSNISDVIKKLIDERYEKSQ